MSLHTWHSNEGLQVEGGDANDHQALRGHKSIHAIREARRDVDLEPHNLLSLSTHVAANV